MACIRKALDKIFLQLQNPLVKSTIVLMLHIDYRGHDLALIPAPEQAALPTAELLRALFGTHLPSDVRADLGQDARQGFVRVKPLHWAEVRRALQRQGTPFELAFEERPRLPFATDLRVNPRPIRRRR